MKISDYPMVLWDYCVERRPKILSATARDLYSLKGTVLTQKQDDRHMISQTFHFWLVWFVILSRHKER